MAKLIFHLSILILSSFTLFANGFDLLSWAHSTAAHIPAAAAPAPHHHKGHHHHHHISQAPAHSPTHSPVHAAIPPVHAAKPPVHAAKPPVHAAKPPVHAAKPPVHAAKPPVHPPSHAHSPVPVHPPMPVRKFVAVQGVVYCKACKYTGVDTLLGATPILGAVVKLQCNNTKYPLVQEAKTDKNGYFFMIAPKTLTTYAFHKCKVTLLSSPMGKCNKPTNFHYGVRGAVLTPKITPRVVPAPLSSPSPAPAVLPYQVFNVGPFAFESDAKTPCPR